MGYAGKLIKKRCIAAAFQTKRLIEKKVSAVKVTRYPVFYNTSIWVVFVQNINHVSLTFQ